MLLAHARAKRRHSLATYLQGSKCVVGEVLATAIFIKYVRIGCCHKYVVDGVSLRHNPGGVGCGQLLLGVAFVVFRFLSSSC